VDCLSVGKPVPEKYYRASIDRHSDELLDEMGVKHLHLGGKDSDILLYAVEFEDRVELLQINGHVHFRTRPKGKLLNAIFSRHLTAIEATAVAGVIGAVAGALFRPPKKDDD